MKTTIQKRARNIKKNVANSNHIYLTAENIEAVSKCSRAICKDESFVVNSLLEKFDLIPLEKVESLKSEAVQNTNRIKTDKEKTYPIKLNRVNIKAVRECASKIGRDESFVVNSVIESFELIPISAKKR